MERLYRERYQGFTVKHFHEHLVKDHGFGWGYTWLKLHLQSAGLAPKAPRKGAHRRKRERRPLPGMMLHQDGSRHAWLEGQAPLDLIVTLDDATGAIYSAFMVEEEGTASTFRALKEVFAEHGLPMSLYTDRGSHYFRTTKAGEIDRGSPTQVGRALAQLGVEHIGAYSPQARGRSERMFGTLQDRLAKELRLAGVIDIEAANAFIRETYLPAHNARFAVEPAGEGSAFTPVPGVDLDEILCVQEERQVGNDNCVSYCRVAHSPTGEQKQKKRTSDVLPNRTTSFAIDSRSAAPRVRSADRQRRLGWRFAPLDKAMRKAHPPKHAK